MATSDATFQAPAQAGRLQRIVNPSGSSECQVAQSGKMARILQARDQDDPNLLPLWCFLVPSNTTHRCEISSSLCRPAEETLATGSACAPGGSVRAAASSTSSSSDSSRNPSLASEPAWLRSSELPSSETPLSEALSCTSVVGHSERGIDPARSLKRSASERGCVLLTLASVKDEAPPLRCV